MSAELRSILESIADSVTLNPSAAGARFSVDGDLVGACEVDVRVGDRTIKVDEPEALGGRDAAPNPVEYALLALGSCQAITYRFWATKLGVRLDACSVKVSGDMDIRGVFGIDDDVRPGYSNVEIDITLGGPESAETYARLAGAVDEHCPVLDIFANPTPVTTTFAIAEAARS